MSRMVVEEEVDVPGEEGHDRDWDWNLDLDLDWKPRHVRKLNFGRSILGLVTEPPTGQRGDRLLFDGDEPDVPTTDRLEYVRKWIETHGEVRVEQRILAKADDEKAGGRVTSAVANGCTALGDCWSTRAKPRSGINNKAIEVERRIYVPGRDGVAGACSGQAGHGADPEDRVGGVNRLNVNKGCPGGRSGGLTCVNTRENMIVERAVVEERAWVGRRTAGAKENVGAESALVNRKVDENGRKRGTVRENYARSPCLKSGLKRSNPERSPVLSRDSYFYKRKRKKLEDTNWTEPLKIPDRSPLVPGLGSLARENTEAKPEQHPERKQFPIEESRTRLMLTEARVSKEPSSPGSCGSADLFSDVQSNSQGGRDNVRIDTESSRNGSSEAAENVNINSDSEATVNAGVEDVEIQDEVSSRRSRPGSRTNSICSRSSVDSDATYFPGAEVRRREAGNATVLSQKISEDPETERRSTQRNISNLTEANISSGTSPPRQNSDPTLEFKLLDSAKRRRKPRKGSLTERLQQLVNSQLSSVRIWRHRVKQSKDTESQRILVRVLSCSDRFTRQFLHGTVIDDPFHLLPPSATSVESGTKSGRPITLMTIPEIVGRIDLRSDSLVQVASPWKVLDPIDLTLVATYVNVVPSGQLVNRDPGFDANREVEETRNRTVERETFDCNCIRTNRLVITCKRDRHKPDVMEHLFPRL